MSELDTIQWKLAYTVFVFSSLIILVKIGLSLRRMALISDQELARICGGIAKDRAAIIKHNPIGTDAEILLWMLLSCLNSYLSLSEQEMPCFTGRPDERTYREAILFVLRGRTEDGFDPAPYIDKLLTE